MHFPPDCASDETKAPDKQALSYPPKRLTSNAFGHRPGLHTTHLETAPGLQALFEAVLFPGPAASCLAIEK